MRTLVTGASGLIGRSLLQVLEDPVVLSRSPDADAGARTHAWHPEAGPPPAEALAGVDVVFHLAGEPIGDQRWNADKKRRIRNSRVLGTRNLVAGLACLDRPPRVLVSASAVGYYGDRGEECLDETSAPGQGFLADVCAEWEQEAMAAAGLGIRVVCMRTGVVLAAGGGALARMLPPFQRGLGGRLGSGTQWMPWIHIDDVAGLLLHASQSQAVQGPMNAVAPAPVTNAEFARALGAALRRPALVAMPRTALRLAFGQMTEMLMASQRVVPRVAQHSGYVFQHSGLDGALLDVIGHKATALPALTAPHHG